MEYVSRFWPWLRFSATAAGPNDEGMEITLKHSWSLPPWATLLLLIGLALLVFWFYLRERSRASRQMRWLLACFRLALLGLVMFMMYGWMIDRHRTDLPDLILVVDDSQSMAVEDQFANLRLRSDVMRRIRSVGLDVPSRWNQLVALLLDPRRGWIKRLDQDYRLKVYRIGGSARLVSTGTLEPWTDALRSAPSETASRLGRGLQQVLEAQRGRPTAAIVLLTDGITTDGRPLREVAELARRKAVPLHIVGLGDDRPPRDIRLTDLLVDDVVFVDDLVNFDFKVQHDGFAGQPVKVRLLDADERLLVEQQVTLGDHLAPRPVRLSHRPQQEGSQEYVVEVSRLSAEANHENNRLSRTILVRDATIRVLLVQAYPNYEFRNLKSLLRRMIRSDTGTHVIELTTVLQDADFQFAEQDETAVPMVPVSRAELFEYDVLIFGDANPADLSQSVTDNIADFVKERGGGVVFLAGPRFTPLAYRDSPLEDLFPIELATATVPDPAALLEDQFILLPTALGLESPHLQLGKNHTATAEIWRKLPGLYWCLSAPDLRPAARVLAEHSSATTAAGGRLPVISMQFVGAGKVVFHATDETYRWSQHLGGDLYYARYWLQLLRYLSRSKLLSDREPAEIVTDRQQYRLGDPVLIHVRFLDERLAPSGDDAVRVVLEAENGRRRELTLRRDSTERGEFVVLVDDLDAGHYRVWLASPSVGEQPASRQIVVQPPAGEFARLEMDVASLREAAQVSRGKFYRIQDSGRLLADLPRGRQVRVESLPPAPLWNSPWLAAAFVGLITAEWVLRKRVGMI